MNNIEKFIYTDCVKPTRYTPDPTKEKYILYKTKNGEYVNGIWLLKFCILTKKLFTELDKYFIDDDNHNIGFDPIYLYQDYEDNFKYSSELKQILEEIKIGNREILVFKFQDINKIGLNKTYVQILQKNIKNLRLLALSPKKEVFILSDNNLIGFIMPYKIN